MPQKIDLYPWMKIRQITAFTGAFYPRWNKALVERLLREWELNPEDRVGPLSVGQTQKLPSSWSSVMSRTCWSSTSLPPAWIPWRGGSSWKRCLTWSAAHGAFLNAHHRGPPARASDRAHPSCWSSKTPCREWFTLQPRARIRGRRQDSAARTPRRVNRASGSKGDRKMDLFITPSRNI